MGMYCRGCYYDLRGQDTPRCPECGRPFDPGDPGSFLAKRGRRHLIWLAFDKHRGHAAIVLTAAWLIVMVIGAPRLHARRSRPPVMGPYGSVVILKSITLQRMAWQHENPDIRRFDRQVARRDLPGRYSVYTQRTSIVWAHRLERWLRRGGDCAVPTAIYALLVIPLVRGSRRSAASGLLVFCLALSCASLSAPAITVWLFPTSHDYLDDYVYIDDVDLGARGRDGQPSTTIAAYDWRSFYGDEARIVAFSDGQVGQLEDDEAKALFDAQGLEYPVQEETGGRD